jgi:hypothetical protein
MASEMADQGASAVMASTGINYANFWDSWSEWSEQFLEEYYLRAARRPSEGVLSLGPALRWNKRTWDGHWYVDDEEEKTSSEYVLYGVPWVTILDRRTSSSPRMLGTMDAAALEGPEEIADNTYVITATFDASGYTVDDVGGGYQLVQVPDMPLGRDTGVPLIPLAEVELEMPLGASLREVEVSRGSGDELGMLNIPAALPLIPGDEESGGDPGGFTDAPPIGPYPSTDYMTREVLMDTFWLDRIYATPLEHNATDKGTVIYQDLQLRITYHLSTPVGLLGMLVDPVDLSPGEGYLVTATLINPSTVPASVTGTLVLENALGQEVAAFPVDASVDPGLDTQQMAWPMAAPGAEGAYDLTLRIYKDGIEQGVAHRALQVTAGRVTGFDGPELLLPGETGVFSVTFANRSPDPFDGQVELTIYDDNDVPLDVMTATVAQDADSEETLTLDWDSAAWPVGAYGATAQVTDAGQARTYDAVPRSLAIQHPVFLPLVLREE